MYVFRSLNKFIGAGIGTSTFYGRATKKSKQYLQICDIALDSLLSDGDSDSDNDSLADPDFVPEREDSESK